MFWTVYFETCDENSCDYGVTQHGGEFPSESLAQKEVSDWQKAGFASYYEPQHCSS
jgi:hypothetical protein